MSHSHYAGTEHRGQVITELHGRPVQQTDAQAVRDLPPSSPDWHDHREHIDGTMKSSPDERHVVYAAGRTVRSFPKVVRFDPMTGKTTDRGLEAANKLARAMKQAATSHAEAAEVTVDPWLSEKHTTNAYTTRPDDRLTQSVYAEAREALAE